MSAEFAAEEQSAADMPDALMGKANIAEICVFDRDCKEKVTPVGVLQAGVCIDSAVFQCLETAEQFWKRGVWPEADGVAVLSEGYGIGDYYDGEIWTKQALSL